MGSRQADFEHAALGALFMFRALSFGMLKDLIGYLAGTKDSNAFHMAVYRAVQNLEKKQLIEREYTSVNNTRPYHIIQLSEHGLETVKAALEIEPGYIGSGYTSDIGDFNIQLQRPFQEASSQNVAHHLMCAAMLIRLLKFRFKQLEKGEEGIDFRDNRHASAVYQWNGKDWRFRPDGELKLSNGNVFLLEADRGTEGAKSLQSKFQGYDRYFKWLKQNGRKIPEGILLVTSTTSKTGLVRRWMTCLQAFAEEMKEWYLACNLVVCTIDQLEETIERLENPWGDRMIEDLVQYYLQVQSFPISPLRIWNIGEAQATVYYTVSETLPRNVQVYEILSHYESKPIMRMLQAAYQIPREKWSYMYDLMPVFITASGERIYFQLRVQEWSETFQKSLWVKPYDDSGELVPRWTDCAKEVIHPYRGVME